MAVMRSAQGIKGEEKGKGQSHAAEDQHIFLTWCEAIDPKAVVEVFLESAGLRGRANISEGAHLAAAHRTAETNGVEVFKGCARIDSKLFHPFGGVVHIATAATLKAMGARIGGRCFGG